MARDALTLLDDGRPLEVAVRFGADSVRLAPEELRAALGWELKPQGLCRGERCVTVRDTAELVTVEGVDLAGFAAAIDRPLALDLGERTAVLGVSAAARGARLTSLEAPDFTLPDLEGQPHSLSDHRGKKILLVAYASW